jgi:hypothetical protein
MAFSSTPSRLEAVFVQRDTTNIRYDQINISGSDLIVYLDGTGSINADKIPVWAAKYGLGSGSISSGSVASSSWASHSISASYALTSSYAITASYALTSSEALNSVSSSYFSGSQITASSILVGLILPLGSEIGSPVTPFSSIYANRFFGTASWATHSLSSSTATSASYASSSSYAVTSSTLIPDAIIPQYTLFSTSDTSSVVIFTEIKNGLSTLKMTSDGLSTQINRDNWRVVRNVSGNPISKGKAVSITGTTGQTPQIDLSDRTTLLNQPSIGVTLESISDDAFGRVILYGNISGIDTLNFAEGGPVFVSDTPGELTSSRPIDGYVQRIGIVVRQHSTQGSLDVDTQTVQDLSIIPLSSSYATSASQAEHSISASYLSGSYGFGATLESTFFTASSGAAIGGWNNGVISSNTVQIGYGIGRSNQTANAVQIGFSAGQNSITASHAVQVGLNAGHNSTSATASVQIGVNAGQNSTDAGNAVQIGRRAGQETTTAVGAVQIGTNAGRNTSNATNAVQIGANAGITSTTASSAVQIGSSTGQNSINATNAVQIGLMAGQNSTSASGSVQIGFSAGQSCPTAVNAVQIGTNTGQSSTDVTNTVQIGTNTGQSSSIVVGSVQIGLNAGRRSITASNAVQIGNGAGSASVNAVGSVQIGHNAGHNASTGSFTTFIGALSDTLDSALSVTKSIAIGYNAKVSGSNMCVIGGTGDDAVKVGIGTISPTATLEVVGNISCSSITGSLFGTASIAITSITASHLSSSLITASNIFLTGSTSQSAALVVKSGKVFVGGLVSDPEEFTYPSLVQTDHSITTEECGTGGYVMNDMVLTDRSTDKDNGAFRAVVSQLFLGNSNIRAGEFHVVRSTGSGATTTWALELGVHTNFTGSSSALDRVLGIYIANSHTGWGVTGSRGDSAIHIQGEDGWKYAIRYLDTNSTTELFSITQVGSVLAKGDCVFGKTQANGGNGLIYLGGGADVVNGQGLELHQVDSTTAIIQYIDPNVAYRNLNIQTNGGTLVMGSGSALRIINGNSGSVGIGTNGDPRYKLYVTGSTLLNNSVNGLVYFGVSPAVGARGLEIRELNPTLFTITHLDQDVAYQNLVLQSGGGDVGIGTGTSSPGARLHVQGNISASSITASVFGSITSASYSLSASYALTASYAGTASVLLGSIESASYALTASYAGTASVLLGSIESASYALTASYAGTASVLLGSIESASYALSASRAEISFYMSAQAFQTSSNVPMSSSTFTAMTFNRTNWDYGNMHNSSSNSSRLTVPVTGKYMATATAGFEFNDTGSRIIIFRINGNTNDRWGYFRTPAITDAGAVSFETTTAILALNANDYVEVYMFQNSGIILNVAGETNTFGSCRFTLTYLSP